MHIRPVPITCAVLAASTVFAGEPSAPLTGDELDARHGAKVYRSACAGCHDHGKDGAPRLDRPESWKSRSFESFSVMENHARGGFLKMPPKGRRPLLSDRDVADAVFYMTQRLEGGETAMPSPAKEPSAQRLDEVAKRGARVMPFDLDKTIHVFSKMAQGGIQQVVAKQGTDAEQIRLIRQHLAEIAGKFSRGDFSAPTRIHGEDMPGLAELKRAAPGSLKVKYSILEQGAQIEYSAEDPALVEALHRWFDAQSSDHSGHTMEGHGGHHPH
ncbi:c-type cytochrome [Methylococcus capsulatus]|jgi:cytochrome c5|uniref:Cytochrome c family protein n=1 Tax=Methylococcus capsulatus TaxID=414 RepID=A0AA35V734_METCP|nr:c-type cytochrome [Methylococcus capsulatus]CAI8847227.1 Cytochrome c family protein [Methylococcus capsulatus]